MIDSSQRRPWLASPEGVLTVLLVACFVWLMAQSGLLRIWVESEEYGHGLMVLAVLGYLVYRRWPSYRPLRPGAGVVVALMVMPAFVLAGLGEASGISLVGYYGIWLFGVAVMYALGGVDLVRALLVPLLIVLLLLPLPNPLGPMLTAELQLVSSKLGVAFIRAIGGVVYQEGNVIDMGGTRLLVAEACAGLRYLFPLMSLGAIAGYVLRAPLWMRWAVFLATVPITIFMNSLRIGVTGVLVEAWGSGHTEGFLHFFEGWVVFVVAALLLLLVMWLLTRSLSPRRNLFDLLVLDAQAREGGGLGVTGPGSRAGAGRAVQLGILVALAGAGVAATVLAQREDAPPVGKPLSEFPSRIGAWQSNVDRLPEVIEQVAGASDYFYGTFFAPGGEAVNLYISYYKTQRQGQIPHSPKVCIPGDGWNIDAVEPVRVMGGGGQSFGANRLLTSKGENRVLAYYWLKQGPRMYEKELLARLDLFRISLLENRTDGALIRLVTDVRPGEQMAAADARLGRFARELLGVIPAFVPD